MVITARPEASTRYMVSAPSDIVVEPPFQRGFAVSNFRGARGYVWKRPS